MHNALSYVAVVCLGNIETITRTTKTSTWLKEWGLRLEFVHGHSLNCWKDIELKSGCNANEKFCIKNRQQVRVGVKFPEPLANMRKHRRRHQI